MTDGRSPLLTECGIPGIGKIPFGVHLCHFYLKRQDLVDSLVPYFQSGLQNNERCIWMTAAPFTREEAEVEMAKVLPSFAERTKEGRIQILDAEQGYAEVDGNGLIERWLQEEEKTLAGGYQGLRIAGNASFLKREDWEAFMDYESRMNKAIKGRRIVALCSYNLRHAKATDVFEVTRNHQHTIGRDGSKWEVVDQAYGPMSQA